MLGGFFNPSHCPSKSEDGTLDLKCSGLVGSYALLPNMAHVCLCVHMHADTRSRVNLQELILSFHYVVPWT